MEIEPATLGKARLFARGWSWLKALLPARKFKKVVDAAKCIKQLGQDDSRRVIHCLKVGLALTFVSLLYYCKPLYEVFGVSGIWAVITVVLVLEFTVGATISKGLNRGFATLFAGALAIGTEHFSRLFDRKAEPIVLGVLLFLLATTSSFTRFIPRIKAKYDYGVMIFILTFSLVSVSGYRTENLLEVAHQRLSAIAIGGATCIIMSVFVCPVWAGKDLHKLTASNLEKLANYLEGFGGEYFQTDPDHEEEGISTITAASNSKLDDKAVLLQGYKSVLNPKNTEESLASFARWEPGHGGFHFRHPWNQYLKIGALARQCAHRIEVLDGYINSDIQAPLEIRNKIRESSTKMCLESSQALRALASSIKTMTDPSAADPHVKNSETSINDLKIALESASKLENVDLLAIIPIASVASILTEITKCVWRISELVHELSLLAYFKSAATSDQREPGSGLHRGSVKPVLDDDSDRTVTIIVQATNVKIVDHQYDPSNTDSLENRIPDPAVKSVRLEER
ncbi:aluminum-activated malate transporter 8-like [Juglans microcarpa x Juglans regia]|uniref:aluminum-activated malate transporter 8-like n=1 Tax=Juglans microcarpa x Juglans regia TaxID=2249226 RepID=UPI001B7E87F0|nr:aluminum-activated malate transporter 8-like [Juglans microcarpa x Juglans regia]